MHCLKSFISVKSTYDEKSCFNLGNELKLTQVELLSFIHFKSEELRSRILMDF